MTCVPAAPPTPKNQRAGAASSTRSRWGKAPGCPHPPLCPNRKSWEPPAPCVLATKASKNAKPASNPTNLTRDEIMLNWEETPLQTPRSEEHTSELQSLMRTSYAVFCLKKKKKQT